MSEFLTKEDLLRHEKEAAERRDKDMQKIQELRHKQGSMYQEVINKIDGKVDHIENKTEDNNKELALLKQNHDNMADNVKEIKNDIKEVKTDIRDFISFVKDKYVTKSEYEKRISPIEKGIWWAIGLVGTGIIGALLKLILIGK